MSRKLIDRFPQAYGFAQGMFFVLFILLFFLLSGCASTGKEDEPCGELMCIKQQARAECAARETKVCFNKWWRKEVEGGYQITYPNWREACPTAAQKYCMGAIR